VKNLVKHFSFTLTRRWRMSRTGWSNNLAYLCTPYNFIKCWPIFKPISLSESGKH